MSKILKHKTSDMLILNYRLVAEIEDKVEFLLNTEDSAILSYAEAIELAGVKDKNLAHDELIRNSSFMGYFQVNNLTIGFTVGNVYLERRTM